MQGPSTVPRGDVLTPELSGFPAVLYLAIAGLFYKCFNETVRGYSLCLFISISEYKAQFGVDDELNYGVPHLLIIFCEWRKLKLTERRDMSAVEQDYTQCQSRP